MLHLSLRVPSELIRYILLGLGLCREEKKKSRYPLAILMKKRLASRIKCPEAIKKQYRKTGDCNRLYLSSEELETR